MAKVESPTFDPSRLPPYRSSFLERFHPYPRSSGQRAEDIFLKRVDYRYSEGSTSPRIEGSASSTRPPRCEDVPNEQEPNMDEAPLPELGGGDGEYEDEESLGPAQRLSGGKLAAAFTDLVEGLRRQCLRLQAATPFLRVEQEKPPLNT